MELSIIVAVYGISWGLFYFLGFRRKKQRVLKNPSSYSSRVFRFYNHTTNFQLAILSFVLALAVPVVLGVVFLGSIWLLSRLLSK